MSGSISGLLDALGTQGGITVLGYVSSVTGVVTEGRSLSQFVSCVALPCLLLKSMASVDLTTVNLKFVAAMTLTKIIVAAIGCALGSRLLPGSRFKSAAMGGLLSTCSNDLAFGLPIVRSLHPDFALYVVILATVQNALLNPALFVLMEIGVAREEAGSPSCRAIAKVAAKRIAGNFVVLAVVVGVGLNLVLGAHLPELPAAVLGAHAPLAHATPRARAVSPVAPPSAPVLERWLRSPMVISLPCRASPMVIFLPCGVSNGDFPSLWRLQW